MKNYLFTFDRTFGGMQPEEVENILNAIPEIVDWMSDLPLAYYLKSEQNAEHLVEQIKKLCPDGMNFIVSEITENTCGFLDESIWNFLHGGVSAEV